MKADTRRGPGRKRQHRGEAREEFHINDRVDANLSDSMHCPHCTQRESEEAVRHDRYHIFPRNDVHCVENEAIVFEYDEVNVFTSDHVDCTPNCRISQNGRALFRELDEENAPNLVRPWWPHRFKDPSYNRQNSAERRTNPAISQLQS